MTMQVIQERPTPVAFVQLVSGHNINSVNHDLQKAMNEALADEYVLIRAGTQVAFNGSHPLWTVTLEFAYDGGDK